MSAIQVAALVLGYCVVVAFTLIALGGNRKK